MLRLRKGARLLLRREELSKVCSPVRMPAIGIGEELHSGTTKAWCGSVQRLRETRLTSGGHC